MLFSMCSCCLVWVGMTASSAVFNESGETNGNAARATIACIFLFGSFYSFGITVSTGLFLLLSKLANSMTATASTLSSRSSFVRDAGEGYGLLILVCQHWWAAESICCKFSHVLFTHLANSLTVANLTGANRLEDLYCVHDLGCCSGRRLVCYDARNQAKNARRTRRDLQCAKSGQALPQGTQDCAQLRQTDRGDRGYLKSLIGVAYRRALDEQGYYRSRPSMRLSQSWEPTSCKEKRTMIPHLLIFIISE